MAINYYDKFVAKLQEIFMMDHAELDFGIYRIMNQKRDEIQKFLQVDLLPQVKQALQGESGNAQQIKQRMTEIEQMFAGMDIETLPESNPNVAEYKKLKAQLAQGGSAEEMEGEVFSHLVTFFSRYYDGGDFLSKRRYKDNTYAIPYNGEEVKLHWANADQYYIKTSEYFRNYTFVLPTSRRKVHFVLKDASTEQNNNKAQNNMERRFALWKPENVNDAIVEVTAEGELNIYFTYELMPKATKQKDLLTEALETINTLVPDDFGELLTVKAPTKENANRTLLEKHLSDYTAKNSFDYFIHKDLGGFLSHELDFFIKNEVLHIDDLNPQHISSQLGVVKAIKQVGQKIIRMLAQLENFQRKLWLKKKFVVQSDYCITLDRVPEKLYSAIIANEAQRKEWVRLFAIDEIKGDMMTEAYSEPLTLEFLKQNPFLVLDTAFFDVKFKHQLVACMENVDEQTNGLLINSENFQALQLLQEKYRKGIKCAYYDPPYNTSEGSFVYKNSYQHSSWCSMLENRLSLTQPLLSSDGVNEVAIDDFEQPYLSGILDYIYGFDNRLGSLVVEIKPSGRTNDYFLATSHEYLLCYAKNYNDVTINFFPLSEEQRRAYSETTEDGTPNKWRDFLRTGGYSTPEERPNSYYPIFYNPVTKDITPEEKEGYIKILPIDSTGKHRVWRKTIPSLINHLNKGEIKVEKRGDQYKVRIIDKIKDGVRPKSVWIGSKYDASAHGTKLIQAMFGDSQFSFPKAFRNVYDSLYMVCNEGDIILDAFAGSGTTGHAVVELNRNAEDDFYRFILCEVNDYCNAVTKPRLQKSIYSSEWRDAKPVSRNGISQCFKYIRLEQYEDTLNNLEIKAKELDFQPDEFKESYMLSYMLDTETRDSLLNLKWFENPFEMTLKTTKDNELVETKVDMVETFNYLIGLNVETEDWYQDDNICVVQGKTHREGLKTLVIWRNCKEVNNDQLCMFFDKMDFRTRDTEFDLIYVNGDNTLPNLKRDEDHWKVVLTEEEFQKRMFEEE